MHGHLSYERMIAAGSIVNHYQPIVDLRTGQVVGVETLARLADGTGLVMPGTFLPGLGVQALSTLLFTSLRGGMLTLAAAAATHPDLWMAFNVSPLVMPRRNFLARLLGTLRRGGVTPDRIALEILESDEFLNLDTARALIEDIHDSGICIALDDVGTGYSSLSRLRDIPVDKIKLDQSFVCELSHKPEGLHFVEAMMTLARGLRTTLVVEGVETSEILDALTVLGVEMAQGYAIARPMPEAALVAWLAARPRPAAAIREPDSMLGAYAAHISIVEACRALLNQPLPLVWSQDVRDPHKCSIGRFFDRNGLHETPYGQAHKRFHTVIDRYAADPAAWEKASGGLWQALQSAIKTQARQCNAVTSPLPGPPPGPAPAGPSAPPPRCVPSGKPGRPARAASGPAGARQQL